VRGIGLLLVALALAACGGETDPSPGARAAPDPVLPSALTAACRELAQGPGARVLCPPVRPGGGPPLALLHADLDPDPCGYLVNLQARDHGGGARPSHLLLGGTCAPLPLRAGRDGRWPAPLPRSLRLVANPPLESGRLPRVSRPRVLRRVTVRGAPGLLLRNEPGTEGGLHGGHHSLVWNEDGAGYGVSLHFGRGVDDRAALATLQRLADALRPVIPVR
jgi:hypothetical protein